MRTYKKVILIIIAALVIIVAIIGFYIYKNHSVPAYLQDANMYPEYLQYKSYTPPDGRTELIPFEGCYVGCAQGDFQSFKSCVQKNLCYEIN
jgi:hypothetical protein